MQFKNYLSFLSFILILLASCELHEKKVDDAFDRVKELKNNGAETTNVAAITPIEKKKIKVIVKNELVNEWQIFKNETDLKINSSDAKIKILRIKKNQSENKNKFEKQTTALEQKNNELRKRMNDYNEEMKFKWEKFKLGMNHDIDEIAIELKDITINNTKTKKQ